MASYKLGIYAMLLELSAWNGAFLMASYPRAAFAWYLLTHAGASLLLSMCANLFLPLGKGTRERTAIIALMTSISYAIPVFGFIGTVLATILLRVYHTPAHRADFSSLLLPAFDPHQRQSGGFRQAGLKTFLSNSQVPMNARLGAMVALQYVPGRVSSPLLRDVLSDPNEDIRLLAYGMLDNKEKQINRSIDEALRQFNAETPNVSSSDKTDAAHRLSDLYWELIYQELAQGDLRDYALHESLKYCDLALEKQPETPPLHLRRGRLLHELQRPQEAELSYLKARDLGMPATRILPYLAELAFDRNDIPATRKLMRELSQWSGLPKLRPVVDYWTAT
ncbi:lipopolysaccharide assembly protein LapB [Azonexus sp.]|uniref:tetratricopeptide repeat protein n=1 Tax=Azonexus sp. TaxID=1872668 RepID=UPI0027BAC14E|nr:hypothetical protein [Azonexus sp.]